MIGWLGRQILNELKREARNQVRREVRKVIKGVKERREENSNE